MDSNAALADLNSVREALARARSIAVLTGAGTSAESGIPTFRDALTGLWSSFKPEQLATPEAFLADPKLVWDWYAWRRERVSAIQPNAGHRALVTLENTCRSRGTRFTLITQNVDGLHQQAGSVEVIELHGNIRRVVCFDHHHPASEWNANDAPPRCAQCSAMLRPDVVWFGEPLPKEALERSTNAARTANVFLSIGTSALVEPAASLPLVALAGGARIIEINPDPTPLTAHATFVLRGNAGMVLPLLIHA